MGIHMESAFYEFCKLKHMIYMYVTGIEVKSCKIQSCEVCESFG